MLLPEDILIAEDGFSSKGVKIPFAVIDTVTMEAEDIQHSYNFVKTHKSLHATLTLQLSDKSIGRKGVFKIKANRGFFTDLRNYEVQKRLFEGLQNLFTIVSKNTFDRRLKLALATGDDLIAFRYGKFAFFKDGTIVKNGQYFSTVDTKLYEFRRSYSSILIRRRTLASKLYGELIGDKAIDIGENKDVILHLLDQLYGLRF